MKALLHPDKNPSTKKNSLDFTTLKKIKNLKLSQYIINVDIWDEINRCHKTMIFSTRTSQIRILDAQSWKDLQRGNYARLPPKIIQKLKENEFLINSEEDEVSTVINENKQAIEKSTHLYTVIQPTAFCPLGCGYCGQLHSPRGLSPENQKNLLLYLRKKLSQKEHKSMSISWFGGEPLSGIAVIDKLSPQIQEIAREYSLDYSASIVTNGLLLRKDIAQRLMSEYAIKHIEITLDGTEKYHDQRRHLKTGGPTFEKIYTNLLNLTHMAPEDVKITIRCNVDDRNQEGISPLLRQIAQDRLHKKVHVYFAQIHSWGNDAHKLAADKTDFAQWEIDWFIEMLELGYTFNYLPRRKKTLCIAVDPSSDLIDPFGNIFSCTEVSLVPSYEKNGENIYKLGHLSDEQLTHPEKRQILGNFYEEKELKKYPCYKCSMLPVCGGACPKAWKEDKPPCPSAKYNIQQRMLLHLANTYRSS